MPLLHAHDADLPGLKIQLRAKNKTVRAALNQEQRAEASRLVCDRLFGWIQKQPQRSVGIFLAQPLEISLHALVEQLLGNDYLVSAPRVDLVANRMDFWRLPSLEAVRSGAFGVREPLSDEKVVPEVVLVPGLAFDPSGGRLGMGGGWYDRVLAQIALRVGVCFEAQIVPEVPREPHDVLVDYIATEARWRERHAFR